MGPEEHDEARFIPDGFSKQQALGMMRFYRTTLENLGYCAIAYEYLGDKIGGSIYRGAKFDALNHACWMCGKVEEFVRQNRWQKAHRWIGFVQGLLFMGGVFSITELKDHNMGKFVS